LSHWGTHRFHIEPYGVDLETLKYTPMSKPKQVMTLGFGKEHFDVSRTTPAPPGPGDIQVLGLGPPGPDGRPQGVEAKQSSIQLDVTRTGAMNAVVMWFELNFAGGGEGEGGGVAPLKLSSGPGGGTHWHQFLQPLEEIRLNEGESLPLRMISTSTKILFGADPQSYGRHKPEKPADATTKVPQEYAGRRTGVDLFDPSWLKHAEEMEKKSAKIAQFCSSSPEALKQACEAACVIAMDPNTDTAADEAAPAIDPYKATMFAGTFFH